MKTLLATVAILTAATLGPIGGDDYRPPERDPFGGGLSGGSGVTGSWPAYRPPTHPPFGFDQEFYKDPPLVSFVPEPATLGLAAAALLAAWMVLRLRRRKGES